MKKNISILSMALVMATSATLPLLAEQDYLEVDNFSGIEIGTGMIGDVSCGNENTITLHGDKRDLDNVEVEIRGDYLEISRKTSAGKILSNIFSDDDRDNSIRVEIVTNAPLSSISGSTGSSLIVPECAVNNSYLKVEAGTGAVVKIDGMTGTLELDLSTGSTFNNSRSNFTADQAEVDLSTGATADLCGVASINGSASTGATIKASETAATDVSLSFGAELSSSRCR